MREIVVRANELIDAGRDFAVAMILTRSGSTPRETGTLMLVESDGSIIGTVGGGVAEAGTIKTAMEAIEKKTPKLLHFDMTNDDAAGEGLICGGIIDIFVDCVDARAEYSKRLYAEMNRLYSGGERGWWGFYPNMDDDAEAGCRQCLLKEDGSIVGRGGDYLERLRSEGESLSRFDVFTVSEEKNIYLKRIGSDGRAVIYGAGHVARQLVPVLTSVGFDTTVIDDREEFANRTYFPTADGILVHSLEEAVTEAVPLSKDSYAVIVTRGHSFDLEVLRQVLGTEAAYIGMIGSRKKRDYIYENLLENGYTKDDIARVHSPIGLDIKAQTPEEIAVSIAAEMILARRNG